MAQPAGQPLPPTGDPEAFARAHRTLLAERDIQFDLPFFHPPQPPAWARALSRLIDAVAPIVQPIFWPLVAAVALAILYALYRGLGGEDLLARWRRRAGGEAAAEPGWRPEQAPARALLAEADALAEAGDFAGAAHLLLQRSIEEIDRNRPALVRPALTSREVAGEPALPPEPRSAFARIVMAVERSLFGGRALAEPDWRECRAAYEAFAFSPEWRR